MGRPTVEGAHPIQCRYTTSKLHRLTGQNRDPVNLDGDQFIDSYFNLCNLPHLPARLRAIRFGTRIGR